MHIDPDRTSHQEMMVEGEAISDLVTLRAAGAAATTPPPPLPMDRSVQRTLLPLRLGGRGAEEVADHAAVSRDLETPCAQAGGGGRVDECWQARLVTSAFDAAALAALRADVNAGHRLDGTLFSSASGSDMVAPAAAELTAPACVGLNLFVRHADGRPATDALHAYLTMGAHAIIARVGTDAMWHVHFNTPEALSHTRGRVESCDAALPGMHGRWEMAPKTPFGPSLVGAWIADVPGTFAVYVMAKVQTGSSYALLTPTFYVDVGPLPSPPASLPPPPVRLPPPSSPSPLAPPASPSPSPLAPPSPQPPLPLAPGSGAPPPSSPSPLAPSASPSPSPLASPASPSPSPPPPSSPSPLAPPASPSPSPLAPPTSPSPSPLAPHVSPSRLSFAQLSRKTPPPLAPDSGAVVVVALFAASLAVAFSLSSRVRKQARMPPPKPKLGRCQSATSWLWSSAWRISDGERSKLKEVEVSDARLCDAVRDPTSGGE